MNPLQREFGPGAPREVRKIQLPRHLEESPGKFAGRPSIVIRRDQPVLEGKCPFSKTDTPIEKNSRHPIACHPNPAKAAVIISACPRGDRCRSEAQNNASGRSGRRTRGERKVQLRYRHRSPFLLRCSSRRRKEKRERCAAFLHCIHAKEKPVRVA